MTQIHNFSAGPAILPPEVYENTLKALADFNGTGVSLLEVSHRGKEFTSVIEETRSLSMELLGLGDEYETLFLQGGASLQFHMVPLNLMHKKAAYLSTGVWASKAIAEAERLGEVFISGSSKDKDYSYIPGNITIPDDADYFHCTSNNTIYGTQIHRFPTSSIPMVCDMSSDIFSREIDAPRFDLIYAGAQKNIGPAGATLVIIKKEIIGKTGRNLPAMLNYQSHIEQGSMFNTPPVFSIFVCLQTLLWIRKMGGLKAMERLNFEKKELLYAEIDRNERFRGNAATADRSWMNVTFVPRDSGDEESFLAACREANIIGIKGHRSVGGFRASLYNALPLKSVEALISVMQTFK